VQYYVQKFSYDSGFGHMTHSGGWVSSSGASSEDHERGREAGEGGGTCGAGRNCFDFEATK
jgi:hypothetical protein